LRSFEIWHLEHRELRLKRKLTASFALVVEAINEIVGKRATLLGAAFLPIAGIFLIDALATEITASAWSQFAILLVTFPLYALFATVVHRVVLLGEHSLPNRWGIFWTERETRFLGWLIGVWLLYFALSLPTGMLALVFSKGVTGWDVAWIATILSYILVAYFQGRFSLVLPATAIDRRSNFKESWAMSRGKGIMIALALVIPAMILIPIEWVLYGAVDDTFKPIVDLVWMLLVLPIFAVEIAIISLAYNKLSFQDRR
jgi:hypothetical protein